MNRTLGDSSREYKQRGEKKTDEEGAGNKRQLEYKKWVWVTVRFDEGSAEDSDL